MSNLRLKLVFSVLFLLLVGFQLTSAYYGYSFYRDQHIGSALIYAEKGIDLFNPVIPGFNATGTPTPQEFPLWQGLAGLFFTWFGVWFGWANLVSILLFSTGLWPLYKLAESYLGRQGAWWVLVCFLAQPLVFILAGQAGTDGLSLVTMLWFLFFADRMVRTGGLKWFVGAAFSGALCAVTKVPFFFAAGLISCFALLHYEPKDIRSWFLLVSTGVFSILIFFLWTKYCGTRLAMAEYPHIELRVSKNPEHLWWYFGNWAYRLDIGNWLKGGWRFLNTMFGSIAIAALALPVLFLRETRLARFWLLGSLLTTLVFAKLVLIHRHYYLMFSPAVALLLGGGIHYFEKRFLQEKLKTWILPLVVFLAALLALVQGFFGMEQQLHFDTYPGKISSLIKQYTAPQDKLIIQGGGWGGNQLILSNRKGLSIHSPKVLQETPSMLERLKELGYNKIILISESPLLHALQVVNPGQSDHKRELYYDADIPLLQSWPTIYQDDNIFIKRIPEVE